MAAELYAAHHHHYHFGPCCLIVQRRPGPLVGPGRPCAGVRSEGVGLSEKASQVILQPNGGWGAVRQGTQRQASLLDA